MNRPTRTMLRHLKTPLIAAAGLATLLTASVQAQVVRQQPICDRRTDICEHYPPVGSHVRRAAAHGMRIDLDKRYADLSAEDKARLHDQFERMPPGDEPPYPAEGLRPLYQAILNAQDEVRTRQDKVLRVEQAMMLVVEVDADGEPIAVQAYTPGQQEMARLVGTVLMKTKFKPAVCAGKPCRMGFPFTLGTQSNIHTAPLR